MNEFKGTPGPWSATNDRVFSTYGQKSGDGHVLPESEKWVIADLIGSGSYGGFEFVELGDDDRQANSKLMAAAPCMFKELSVIRDTLPHTGLDTTIRTEMLRRINAVIAKATA